MAWMKQEEMVAKKLCGELEEGGSTWKYDYIRLVYNAPEGYELGLHNVGSGRHSVRVPDVSLDKSTGDLIVMFRKLRPGKEQ